MKGAMWALGIFLLSIFALVLINLFGNITITNQQNYLLMKNSVEAAVYDSVDIARYRNGFCLCTKKSMNNGKYEFTSSNDYTIIDPIIENGNKTCSNDTKSYGTCNIIEGGYKIKADVFAESLVRRFSETINGNKNYRIIVKDVIEYPPKVSIEIKSYDAYNLFSTSQMEFDEEDFSISNKIDAILENKNS